MTAVPATIPQDPIGSTGSAARRGVDWEAVAAVGFVAMVLVPVATLVLTRTGHSYTPAGDLALIDLRVREIWSGHIPLVGPYGNRGWSHPGPLLFDLLAIPSLLAGRAAWGTQVGAALLQGLAAIWLARLAWRRGGLALTAVTMVGVSLIGNASTAFVLRDPWNPHVVLPFFALFVFQGWLLATGEPRLLPGAVAVATLLVQSHVGYVPMVAAVAGFVAVCVGVDRVRHRPHGEWRRPVAWALGVGALLWLAPLVDLVVHWQGNLAAVARYFLSSDPGAQRVGIGRAAELLAEEFSAQAPWIHGPPEVLFGFGPVGRSAAWLAVPVVLIVAGVVVARRRGDTLSVRFVGLAGVLLVVGVLAIARVDGTVLEYQFLWRPVVAVAVVGGAGWATLAGTRFGGRWLPIVALFAAALVVVWSSGMLARDVARLSGDTERERATESLTRQAVAHGIPAGGVILRLDEASYVQLQRGVFNELRREGVDVFVDDELAYQFPSDAAAAQGDAARVWWVADSGAALADLTSSEGADVVAEYSPLSRARERRAQLLEARLLGQLRELGRADLITFLDSSLFSYLAREVEGLDHDAAEELSETNAAVERRGSLRGGIVAFDRASAPERLRLQ